jgi:hypothetical protein
VVSEQPDAIDVYSLTFTDEPVADVPPVPGPDDVKVARSYRLPVELDQWIIQTASAKGVKPAALVRDLLELGRAAYQEADRPVSLADVLAALAALRSRDAA